MRKDKDGKGVRVLMVIDSIGGRDFFSVNNGKSLKDFRKENNLIRGLFDQKCNRQQQVN